MQGLSTNELRKEILEEPLTYTSVEDGFDQWDDDHDAEEPEDARQRPAPATACNPADPNEIIPPERRPLILPSTHLPQGHPLRDVELRLRIARADAQLAAIREAVAEKSFQYSHILKAAPTKAVRTRSRTAIAKLNTRLILYCRLYGRTRAALVRLRANIQILNKYQILLKEDVKASTAMMQPNLPGASSLRLSWIWQTQWSGLESTPDGMRECKSSLDFFVTL